MSIPPELLAAGSAVLAATLAGLVAFIVSVLSKDQKTSEFRQAWIDSLRKEIAVYISKNTAFMQVVRIQQSRLNADEDIGEYVLSERFQDMLDIEALRATILLRLNPIEHKALITLINNIYGKNGIATPDSYTSNEQRIEALLIEAQRLLKYEWGRVKKGEPVFFWTKWLSLTAAVTAILIGLAIFTNNLHIVYAPILPVLQSSAFGIPYQS